MEHLGGAKPGCFRSEGHNTSEGSAGDQDGSDQQENGLQSVGVIEF